MAKPGQAQDETMDDILASIRRVINENDRGGRARPTAPWRPEPSPPVDNVARLFEDDKAEPVVQPGDPAVEEMEPEGVSNVVDLAMAQAMEEARAEVAGEAAVEAAIEAEMMVVEEAPEPAPAVFHPVQAAPEAPRQPTPPQSYARPAEPPSARERVVVVDPHAAERAAAAQPLLSPQTDAAVAGAFSQLASTMLSRSGRTVDELVEDLMRPMLQAWLDDNLPSLVERLVREEIERVSRGRR